MNVRTTIMLEKPILERIREEARRHHQTLRETIRTLILSGLAKKRKEKKPLPILPTFNLGKEKIDISNRVRMYEMLEEKK